MSVGLGGGTAVEEKHNVFMYRCAEKEMSEGFFASPLTAE